MPFDIHDESTQRFLLAIFFFPAFWLLCRKHMGDLIVGLVLAGFCAVLFTNSADASLVLYIVGCAVIRGGRLERGVAIAFVGVFLLFIVNGLCNYSPDTAFLLDPSAAGVSPHHEAILKLVVLIGIPHLVLGLWPIDEDELVPKAAEKRPTKEILDDQCEAIRKCAVEGNAKEVVPLIVQMLQVTEDDNVRLTCMTALKRLGETSKAVVGALETARDRSDSSEVKAAAGETIAALNKKVPAATSTEASADPQIR